MSELNYETRIGLSPFEKLGELLRGINNIARNAEQGVRENQREWIVKASAEAGRIVEKIIGTTSAEGTVRDETLQGGSEPNAKTQAQSVPSEQTINGWHKVSERL